MTDERIKIEVDVSDVQNAKVELNKLRESVGDLKEKSKNTASTVSNVQKEIDILSSVSKKTSKAVNEVSDALNSSTKELKAISSVTQKAAQDTTTLGESEDQAAQRIKKMVAASVERKKAADEAAESSRRMVSALSNESKGWQEAYNSQNKSMAVYHKTEQALQAQAIAEEKAREAAQKTAAETEKKNASLSKLLGAIDKTEKALGVLDAQELELSKHFKEGRISVEAYNNALAKIKAQKNALTNVKNEAKNTTIEVNKLSKAVKVLSGLAITGFAGYGVVSFGKSIIETTMRFEKAKTILENTTESASKAADELKFIEGMSEKLGIGFIDAANSYAKLMAAAKDSPEMMKEIRGMFEGVSEAAAAFGLETHEVNSILVNFEQMLSKGKVDLTDLKQIANLIPGTMDLAAKGLGTTTKQMSEWISKGLIPASEFLPRFSDQLHAAFGGSAQSAAQGLKGQLSRLTDAWDKLKLEAGNAGFINTFTDAVKGLTDILKDPAVKEGLNLLIQGMSDAATYAVKGAAGVSSFADSVGKEFARITIGMDNTDDPAKTDELIKNNKERIERLKKELATLQSPNYSLGVIDKITGSTIESKTKKVEEELSYVERMNKGLIQQYEDLIENLSKPVETDVSLDPLIKNYQEAASRLDDIRKEIKEGNAELDDSVADYKYQESVNDIKNYVTELENTLAERNATLTIYQEQYNNDLASLSAEQKAILEGDIEQTKSAVSRLAQELLKYKDVLASTANTETVRGAFVPQEKAKKTGRSQKSEAQKQEESNEKWVKDLEKQKATMGLSKVETLNYEIAQRKLTGALLERANAIKILAEEEQKKENAKTNTSMQIELLRISGDTYQADLLEMQSKLKETTEKLKKEGNIEGIAIAKELFNANIYRSQIDQIKGEIDDLFSYQSRQEQAIQAQVQVGLITQYQGQKKLTALHKQTAEAVEKYLPELEKAASMPGEMGKQSKAYLADINTQVLTLKETTSELENAFRNGLQDGIQSSIQGLVDGTMNLQDALKNFVDSIASNILNVVTQNIAEQATNGIVGGLKGLDSMFGFGVSAEGETTPESLAISTASQEGALAMQTGIEQGGINAAQTISNAISGMNGINGGLGGSGGLFGNVTQQASEAVGAINTVKATKTAADASLTASAVSSAATTQATTTAAASSAQAAWAPAAASAATASFGTAAMIGLSALMMVMTSLRAFATGGHVRGEGTGTSDSIPAWLSNGEFVTRAKVVKQPGMLDFMKDLNNRGWGAVNDITRVRHSTGGLAGVPAPIAPSLPSINVSPMESSNNTTLKNNINLINVDDPNKVADKIANHAPTGEAIETYIIRNNQKIRQILQS